MSSICLITCYMGPLPRYFGYYTASCKKNSDIQFVVINDSITGNYVDGNIRFIRMNLHELNSFASAKLGVEIKLQNPWKINELKPLFGRIFREMIGPADFWGWCDLDIIWGDLRKFLNEKLLGECDVITSKVNWCAGHFTLFRNNEICNSLYQEYSGITDLLNSPTYYAFEESCHRWIGELFSFDELQQKNLPVSMFDIVKRADTEKKIRAHFKDIIREYPQPINYVYREGKLVDRNNGEEFMYYHLIVVKKIWRFYIPLYRPVPESLVMTGKGIRYEGENQLVWNFKRTWNCSLGIMKSVRKKSLRQVVRRAFRIKSERIR